MAVFLYAAADLDLPLRSCMSKHNTAYKVFSTRLSRAHITKAISVQWHVHASKTKLALVVHAHTAEICSCSWKLQLNAWFA